MKRKKHDVRRAARSYIRSGWRVVPVKPSSKAPKDKEWQKLRISEDEVNEHFHPSDNIGLVLGEPSGGLIDIDCDCDEAVGLAKTLLPPTEMTSGRQSRP